MSWRWQGHDHGKDGIGERSGMERSEKESKEGQGRIELGQMSVVTDRRKQKEGKNAGR